MMNCPKCGKKNSDDAEFCNKCSIPLKKIKPESQLEKNIENFGEKIDKIGKKIEEKGKKVESWYDAKFGFFGPVLSSLIAFVILLIVIKLLSYLGTNRPWMISISNFLQEFILLFLFVFLLSGFSNYFSKKYRSFRFFSPIIGAVVFLIWFWITINILTILSADLNISILGTIAEIFELLIIPIAILILLLGYLGMFISNMKYEDKTPTKKSGTKSKTSEIKDVEYKRLFRSGKDKILGGICGGIGEYFKIDPVIVRIIFVVGLFVSMGFIILVYLIFWIIVPRNPNHNW